MTAQHFEFEITTIKIQHGEGITEIPINIATTLRPGDLCILSGRSGSGKSLCCQFLADVSPHHDYSRSAINFGASWKRFNGNRDDFLNAIQIVPQCLNKFFVAPTSSEELEFSLECHNGRNGVKNKRRSVLRQLGIVGHTLSLVPALSAGERQLVAVGSAIARSPKVLVLDEPEHFLSNTLREKFLQAIKSYIKDGGILILSTHNPSVYDDLHSNPIRLSIGGSANDSVRTTCAEVAASSDEVLSIGGSDVLSPGDAPSVLFSFDQFLMKKRECILLTGPNGAGKTTFLRNLCGFVNDYPAAMKLNGRIVSKRNPPVYPNEIAYISHDPICQMFGGSPFELLSKVKRDLNEVGKSNADKLLDYLTQFGIPKDRKIADMSFGERQVVALASFPNIPDILLVDEPPFSYELRQMQVIVDILSFYRERGCSVLLSTHYSEFYLKHVTRLYQIDQHWLQEGNLESSISPGEVEVAVGCSS